MQGSQEIVAEAPAKKAPLAGASYQFYVFHGTQFVGAGIFRENGPTFIYVVSDSVELTYGLIIIISWQPHVDAITCEAIRWVDIEMSSCLAMARVRDRSAGST